MIEKYDSTLFDWQLWRAGSIKDFNILCRYRTIIEKSYILRKYAVGYCRGENLICRPKINNTAIMFYFKGRHFWFHLRNNEFNKVFKEQK